MTGQGPAADFGWFYGLLIDDQVALLGDPGRSFNRRMAERIAAVDSTPRRLLTRHRLGDMPRRWTLAESASQQLGDALQKLDAWWDSDPLTDGERDYLIEHRDDDYPPARTVLVESAMVRAYLEMKSR